MVCADVGLQVGPPGRTRRLRGFRPLAMLPLDGIFLTQAAIPTFSDILIERPSLKLVVRLDWCNQWRGQALSPVPDGTGVTISTAAQAAEGGADAVVHYVLLGHSDPRIEADYVLRASRAVAEAHAVGLPCILEPLIRGGNACGKERSAGHMALGIRTAIELGADAVKIESPDEADITEVMESASVPVLLASTPPISDDDAIKRARRGRSAGAAGVAYSADFFESTDAEALLAELRILSTSSRLGKDNE